MYVGIVHVFYLRYSLVMHVLYMYVPVYICKGVAQVMHGLGRLTGIVQYLNTYLHTYFTGREGGCAEKNCPYICTYARYDILLPTYGNLSR